MAKVDNIIQQIRNAQADAIRKNGTANGQAIQNDTVKFLKESISQQQSAGKDAVPSGQAETPALPEVQDTRTTQQKLDDAKKVYDDYVSSDEYKQNQVANLKAQTDEWMNATIAGSEGYTPTPRKDQKEQELKAEADYWKAQVEAEENQKVMDADLEELAGWSEQDRRALEQYATGQDVDFYNTLNFAQNGIQVGTAEQNAAGLFEKYGKEKVDQIAESFKRNQSQKLTQETAEAGQKHGDEHAVLSSLGSVATNTVGGVTGVLSYIRELGQRSGRYSTLDPNSIGNLGNVYSGAVRGQVAQNIAGEDGSILRQGAAYLYQGGMTMVDSFARAAAGGGPGGAAALAACNAFSQTVSDASRQGATPEQAYTLGVAVAGVEYLSEKIPMDRVFKLAKAGDTKVLVQAFKQAGIEISTEELSLLGSMAAEAAILQEKSTYKQQIGDLVAGGASYEEAKTQADKAVWEEAKQTALVSGFAGSLSGGGAALVGKLTTNATPEVTEEVPQEVPTEVAPAAPVVDEGQQIMEAVAAELPQQAPQQEAQPVTPEMQQIEAALAETLGVQPVQTTDNSTGNKSVKLYRGYNQSDDPTKKNLTKQQSVYNVLGREDPNEIISLLPLAYYTENEEDARSYADMDVHQMDEYRKNGVYEYRDRVMRGKDVEGLSEEEYADRAAKRSFLTMHGREPNAGGRVERYDYTPGKVLDLTELGEMTNVDAAYKVLADKFGIELSELDNILTMGNNFENDFPAFALLRNTPRNNLGSKIIDLAKKAGYDSVRYSEDGNSHYAIITDRQDWDKNLIKDKGFGYYDEFEDWGKDPNREGVENPLSDRSYSEVGKRSVKAYMYENPAVKPFYQEQAAWMLSELSDSTKGERTYNEQLRNQQNAPKPKKDIYFHLQSIAPEASFFDDNNNITEVTQEHFTLMDDNSVDLDLTPYSSGINRAGAIIDRFGVLYDFALDGEPIDPGDPTYRDIYVTFEDVERPIPRKIDGGSFVPDKKGVINLYSDMREIPHLKVKTQARNLETAASQKESAPVLTEAELAQMAMEDLMGGQEQTTKAVSNPIDSYLNLLRGQQNAPDVDTYEAPQMGASNILQQSTEDVQGIKGTGAAERDFSGKPAYNATLAEDNAQADRRDDVRPMELPRQDVNSGNVSAVTGNVYGSRITPDEFASLMEEPTARGDFSYAKITNDQATQRATETIASAGTWENAYDSWKQSVSSGNAGAEMSARGALLLNHAAQQGDKQLWLETLHYMQKLGTNTAQGLQAFRIIRTLQPADKIEFVRMSVEKMAAEVKEKHGIDLELDQTLIEEFENADTDEARDAILEDIQQDVASQIPSTFLDKWTALRYMNMLGNLKTNVRNIAGNIGSAAVYRVKDTIATGMESVAHAVSGGKTERTKSLFVRKSLLDACKEDFNQFKETVSSGGKYGERMSASSQFEQGVQDKRRIFKNPVLEAYRKGTNWMMNNGIFGDEAFGRAAYSRALAGYLQANGVTGSDLSEVDGTLLDRARAYAIKEAQEATFHDNSTLAQIVSKVQKDTGIVGQGLMPFTKTPANVLTRAEEFSPLGLINSTVKSIQKARGNEDISGADVVNSWAKTITGVGLFALGAAMMDQGLLTGGPDEDEEKAEFDELVGKQNYAIQLPGGINYTIDWLTPAAMPMFMGAQFWKLFSDDRDLTFADMEQVFTSIADPMIQMSMLQGLNDSLDNIKYSDNNLGQFFINSTVSYLSQGLTNTLMGQIERSTEKNRMTTYVDKDSDTPVWLQKQLGKASQKIPGWDYQQTEYRNAWGETEENEGGLLYNLLSPGYISTEHSDLVSRELYRLRETTGENVFPQTVEKTVSFTDTDGNHHAAYNLSQSELETMQKVEGQTAARLMAEVMTNGDYSGLTDKQKAQVAKNINSYAQEEARKQALPKYYSEASAWMRELGDDAANGLIRRAALSKIDSSVTNTVDNIENGWEVTPAAKQDLDSLYDAYAGMSKEAKKQILDDAISDTAKYLEIRSRGISTDQYLDVVTDIKALKPEPNYSAIRDIQTREAIAENDSLSTREKDYVMKAYMTDYDPTAKSPQTTELKYDEIRKLGVSPEGYTAAYRDYLDASGTGKRRRTIALYVKKYGWDRSTAQKVYDLYAGYWKPWKE